MSILTKIRGLFPLQRVPFAFLLFSCNKFCNINPKIEKNGKTERDHTIWTYMTSKKITIVIKNYSILNNSTIQKAVFVINKLIKMTFYVERIFLISMFSVNEILALSFFPLLFTKVQTHTHSAIKPNSKSRCRPHKP